MILLAAFLALTMTEEGPTPTPPEDPTTWAMMVKIESFTPFVQYRKSG
jgi:hypothetical protein